MKRSAPRDSESDERQLKKMLQHRTLDPRINEPNEFGKSFAGQMFISKESATKHAQTWRKSVVENIEHLLSEVVMKPSDKYDRDMKLLRMETSRLADIDHMLANPNVVAHPPLTKDNPDEPDMLTSSNLYMIDFNARNFWGTFSSTTQYD